MSVTGFVAAFCASAALACLPAAAAADECPNAAFRTGPSAHLPECRAYEMVSPSYKATGPVEGFRASPDGTSGAMELFAAVNGAEALQGLFDPGPYTVQRTASGWVALPDEPPASEYLTYLYGEAGAYEGSSLDGQTIVFGERRAGQPDNSIGFFERLPDRSVVDVGPGLPPSTPAGEVRALGLEHDLTAIGMSADGSRLFFALDNEFWPGDGTATSGGLHSLYEYLGSGNTTPLLVGVDSEGRQISDCGTVLGAGEPTGGGGYTLVGSSHNAVSMDGNTVFFTAYPAGYKGHSCTAAVAPPVAELFARMDNGLPGAHTVSISQPSEADCAACYTSGVLNSAGALANAYFVGASRDGSKVFFATTQPLLGTDTSTNLYEYDFDAPAGERLVHVSAGDATVSNPTASLPPVDPASAGWVRPVVSEDGSHVYFVARGVLTKTPNAEGEAAAAGAFNLYVYERDARYPSGHTAFVARLTAGDLPGGSRGLLSVTPDGRFAVFTSERDLTPDDVSKEAQQVFEYDAESGATIRISVGQHGFNHDGNFQNSNGSAGIVAAPFDGPYQPWEYSSELSVSADGSHVFFESPAALTPEALNDQGSGLDENVYEYHSGEVSLISDGQDTSGRLRLFTTDESGEDVFIGTVDRLVGQDTDTNFDLYDARVDGGFPAPVAPTPCAGEACQGALSGAPTLLSPGSEFQQGGNPPLASPSSAPKSKSKPKRRKPAGGKGRKKRTKRRGRASRTGVRTHETGGRS